ncbi:putative protease Do-like 14 isoform X2 [Durio zibethinus]|uniref:Protease Do-like 14 isoform X2 n=1 Tax=Durio zibethinus TaxID=66656 RepID=A0A6P6ALA5_DURZI|nr:putative protease Do-like 14 isoform X2 [Durio zibethinus]
MTSVQDPDLDWILQIEECKHVGGSRIKVQGPSKVVALKVSPSVVCLLSHTGKDKLFACSGTIVECGGKESDGTFVGIILTSASLLRCPSGAASLAPDIKVDVLLPDGKLLQGEVFAYDFHYNLSVIKIRSDTPFPTPSLRNLDESIPVTLQPALNSTSPRHSDSFKIRPGDKVKALGRHYHSHSLVIASGSFTIGLCEFDCQELMMSTCKMGSQIHIGGPLINCAGEVIGINFYHERYTPFLPINIAYRCLEHLKIQSVNRPWLGMELTNFYAVNLADMEKIVQKFPHISEGVVVEKVVKGSPAEVAGILPCDVIVSCGGHSVRCSSEFFGITWDKTRESVPVVVMRASCGNRQMLTIDVEDTSEHRYNRWPIPSTYLDMFWRSAEK